MKKLSKRFAIVALSLVTAIRPFHDYGHFYTDDDAFKNLAFNDITLKVLDNLNEEQHRMHEATQVQSTETVVGETIGWNEGSGSGSVTTTKIGTSTSGRQCREFQQTLIIGGIKEQTLWYRLPAARWFV